MGNQSARRWICEIRKKPIWGWAKVWLVLTYAHFFNSFIVGVMQVAENTAIFKPPRLGIYLESITGTGMTFFFFGKWEWGTSTRPTSGLGQG